ncbi:hypothetical protein DVJ78_10085 [Humibacter sp. BT305]|uniref:Uncharacterized protein n=1 Tax=Cnuibacter physcomitrellae TaxID=1619308 RepID=A0A1X9LKD0_9MICO|nr:hypothetical protein [Cnuibacter physcomitrellae]ARJ05666.1 hypothetical protein B5808_10860 [Cnuibacter physcomitrellae]AXH35706.1 hypothetical protein DVJ78_10085 [Humibacter sp. BT305]MCS5496627.1 hypothetical protein [Cnuibacter physcomitrellae]GGI36212.1 hypothetical protein GCM10010988_07820 [Cnuibacter physcomitrellae]
MRDDDDPTRVTNQPSLTTSTGTIWLVVGGIMAAICVALLAAMLGLQPAGVAFWSLIAIVVLYGGMLEVRLLARPGRVRLTLLAVLFGLIAATGLASVLAIGLAQAR